MAVEGIPGLIRWAPFTSFKAGERFAAPNGDIVTANVDFTSGATYSATDVTASAQDGRIGALEVLGGISPGNTSDAAVSGLLNSDTNTRIALDARYVNEGTPVSNSEIAGLVTGAGATRDALDARYVNEGTPVSNAEIAGLVTGAGATQAALDARFQQNIPLTTTLNFYLSPTGSDANDGLTAGSPKQTFQAVFDMIKAYATYVGGQIFINAAAGTYPMGNGQQSLSARTANRVVVRGPSVSGGVPTAIIDGAGGGDYQHGLSAQGIAVRVEFRDLKFINFNGDPAGSTRSACLGEQEADLYTNNVHVNGASWAGVYAFNTVRARIYGGIIENCRDGVAVNDTDATVGQSSAPISIKNCTEFGVYWSRGSQGHVDYATIQDCSTALMIDASSRVDTVAVNFKRNNVAISTRTGGVYNEGGSPNVYNDGTADANITNFNFMAYSGKGDELGASRSWSSPAYDRVLRTVTGTTSLTPINATLWTVPARRLQGVGKRLRIHAYGIHTVTAGSSYTITVGGMSLTLSVPAAAAGLSFEIDAELHEVQGGYRMFGKISQGVSASRQGNASTGFVNSVDNAIGISVTPANAADTTSIYSTDIYVMG
ncbi:hypothetical protein [Arthrobacter sp. 31Y]|uniref:hypothetical protein n=1 Tax=Arthrobacter sp. 31Y TaxID=1115632 RepID=UPI00046713F9|nr:hypothetical protein [Arthrobacter sp. 31Y]